MASIKKLRAHGDIGSYAYYMIVYITRQVVQRSSVFLFVWVYYGEQIRVRKKCTKAMRIGGVLKQYIPLNM